MTMYPRIDVFHVFSYLLGIGNCGRERETEREKEKEKEKERGRDSGGKRWREYLRIWAGKG